MNVVYRRGIYLPEADLWLDPQVRQSFAVVSHAHSDHIGAHAHVLTSVGTAALMRHRLSGRVRYRALPFGETVSFSRFRLTLFPAGHVLGSAQALVETESGRLLYSGDFKIRPGKTAEPIEIPEADVVVMETTFGRPQYLFPPTEEVVAGIRDFGRAAIGEGVVPVLFAYALGKGPELVALLGDEAWDLVLHPTLFDIVKCYEELGVTFPPHRRLLTVEALARREGSDHGKPSLYLCPPQAAKSLEHLPRRTAQVSGWALDRGAAYRYGVDACFPLSDHADYPELIEYVKRTGASRILTLHGFDADFAQDLRLLGYDARALTAPAQLSLF